MPAEPYRSSATGDRRSCSCITLLAFAFTATLRAAVNPAVHETDRQAGVQVGRYHLQSNRWVNLHQWLLYEARFEAEPPAGLSGDALKKWNDAVETYRSYFGKRNPIFDAELIRLNAALSAMSTKTLPASIAAEPASALRAAMPLYIAAQWDEDDRANRFWIALAEPMLASAGEELAAAHTKAYGVPFPTHILVDVTSFAWQFGAYTVGEGDTAHAVISSVDPGTQGFAALESLMHEPSHAIVDVNSGTIGGNINRIARELGLRPRYNLWHAILFYTAGELTRRALAERGVRDYVPVISEMYDRQFRGFREPLETEWQAFLDGRISREEAIRRILVATSDPK